MAQKLCCGTLQGALSGALLTCELQNSMFFHLTCSLSNHLLLLVFMRRKLITTAQVGALVPIGS